MTKPPLGLGVQSPSGTVPPAEVAPSDVTSLLLALSAPAEVCVPSFVSDVESPLEAPTSLESSPLEPVALVVVSLVDPPTVVVAFVGGSLVVVAEVWVLPLVEAWPFVLPDV